MPIYVGYATGSSGGSGTGNPTPIYVLGSTTYTVPDNSQCVCAVSVTIDGFVQTDGYLVTL